VIDEESDRLNRYIEGLSTPDQTEPMQPIHLRAIDVATIVGSALHRAETLTRDHRVVVSLDDALPAVSVDAASMTEVIYILLDNASKYAPSKTTITVRAARDGEHSVRIAVSDEGPGIAELRGSACSRNSSACRSANRTIRIAAASVSGCQLRGVWSRRKPVGSSSRPPPREKAPPS
jgi:K+-sensing histidine kinase KdpD